MLPCIVIYFFLNNQQDALIIHTGIQLEKVVKNLHKTYQCRIYSRKFLMVGREDARNM